MARVKNMSCRAENLTLLQSVLFKTGRVVGWAPSTTSFRGHITDAWFGGPPSPSSTARMLTQENSSETHVRMLAGKHRLREGGEARSVFHYMSYNILDFSNWKDYFHKKKILIKIKEVK